MSTHVNLPTVQSSGLSPVDGLYGYLNRIGNMPVLNVEEEIELCQRVNQQGDKDALKRLVLSNLKFVVFISNKYKGYGLSQRDLIQEGTIGLMKAISKFDPKVGVRLVTFAVHWIKSEIHDFVLKNWKIVKIATTKSDRKLFFNLRKKVQNIYKMTADEVDHVASELNVKREAVLAMQKKMMSNFFRSLDAPLSLSGESSKVTFADTIADEQSDPCQQIIAQDLSAKRHVALHQAMCKLDDRLRYIVEQRWPMNDEGPKRTLQDVAHELSVSTERVRQLEKKAFGELKGHLIGLLGSS